MAPKNKRLEALENAAVPEGRKHWLSVHSNWDREVALTAYGRDRIGPDDEVTWLVWRFPDDCAPAYPSGYFDEDGRWARALEAHGVAA